MRLRWAWKCSHRRLSFPVVTSQDRAQPGRAAMPHVTCLECGREFWYDWVHMRRGKEREAVVLFPDGNGRDRAA